MGKHGQYGALVGALIAAFAAAPAAADCRLALALGIDVSRSIDAEDYEIQRRGLIAALAAPEVRAAFLRPPDQVRLTVYEWSAHDDQRIIVPWVTVEGPATLNAAIALIDAYHRPAQRRLTGLGGSLLYGRALLDQQADCALLTLDISGDGQNNEGISPAAAYASTDFQGVTVNGLAIGEHEGDISSYYTREVIHGPGAFVEPAASQYDFPRAMRRKLERELTARLVGQADLPRPGADASKFQ